MLYTDVVIVGGGLAGLTSAVALADRGLSVTLVETTDTLGGRAQSLTDDPTGERVDLGPHILLSQYQNMLSLLKRLGTEDQVVWQDLPRLILVDPPNTVNMRLWPLPAPLHFAPSFLNVPQVSLWDQLSNRQVMWQIHRLDESDVLRLDALNAEQYLRSMGVKARAIDWFWRTAAMTIMNVPLELCSAGALFRFIRYLIGRNDFLIGFAGVGLGDLFAPAAAERVQAGGGQILMDTDVRQFLVEDGRLTGVRLGDGTEIRADACIAAVTPMALKRLLPSHWAMQHPFAKLDRFEPSPYICTYLWFADKLTREPFWTKIWAPNNLNYDFYDLSNIRPALAGSPSLIASNCMHSIESSSLSDADIIRKTRAEIAQYLPQAAHSDIRHARVHRVPMGITKPAPGTEQIRPDTTTPITGLYLAGDWINTGLPCSMESASRAGWLAAERVLAAAGQPCTLAQPLPRLTGLARVLGKRSDQHG